MSVRLAKAMPYTSPEFWLKMQLNYDLWKAQKTRQPKIKPFPARPQKELTQPLFDIPTEDGQRVRLCTLVAQNLLHAQRRLQAGGGERTDGKESGAALQDGIVTDCPDKTPRLRP